MDGSSMGRVPVDHNATDRQPQFDAVTAGIGVNRSDPDAVPLPARKGLKPEAWPAQDRLRWQRAKVRQGLFDREAVLQGLKPPTVRGIEQSLGRFLGYVTSNRGLPAEGSVGSVLTPELVDGYVGFMRAYLRAGSVHEELRRLRSGLGILLPGTELGWMNSLPLKPTRAEVLASRKPITRPDAARLLAVAYRVFDAIPMTSADTVSCLEARDCLIVAFCALFDLRLKDLTRIQFGEELRHTGGRWQLVFVDGVKNGTTLVYDVPAELAKRVESHRATSRAVLLRGRPDTGALWIGRTGKPIQAQAVADAIEGFGYRHLGRPLNSHAFRHCFASTIVTRNPADVDLAAAGLGHTSNRMVHGTYTRSAGDEISKMWLKKLALRRRPKRGR